MTDMNSILSQIKTRRLALRLKQSDMYMRTGISRQQYQRLESRGNPRLDTLALVADGLDCELMLIPRDKRAAVRALLDGHACDSAFGDLAEPVSDNPWRGLLGGD